MIYTLYHAPEDSHLVRPLARFMELAEVDLVQVDGEPKTYAQTGVVLCGSSYALHPWLKQALRRGNTMIAVLLADVDPGVKKAPKVDLRAWPSHTADRTLIALTQWLKTGGETPLPEMREPKGQSTQRRRLQNIGAFLLLAAIVGLFMVMIRYADQSPASRTAVTPAQSLPTTAPQPVAEQARRKSIADDASPRATSEPVTTTTTPPAGPGNTSARPDQGSSQVAMMPSADRGPSADTGKRSTDTGPSEPPAASQTRTTPPSRIHPDRPQAWTRRAELDRCFILQRDTYPAAPPAPCAVSAGRGMALKTPVAGSP